MAPVAALAADEKLATDVVVLDVSEQLVITDCFVIASAPNERQVNAIVDNIEEKLREARSQAGPPRGHPRGPLGAARLRRHRRPRPAQRGAQLLRARAAVEGLPGRPGRRASQPRQPTIAADARTTAWSRRSTAQESDAVDGCHAARAPSDPAAARADRVQRRQPDAGPARHRPHRTRSRAGQARGAGAGRAQHRSPIVSSDLRRAYDTAVALGDIAGLPVAPISGCARRTSGRGRA